jgi:hypothetical protein
MKVFNLIKNKKILIIISSVILVLAIASGITYYWYIGTPEYSLKQLRSAYLTRNSEEVLKYVDVDSVFDNFWKEIQKQILDEMDKSDNDFARFGYALGQSAMENMKPALKEKMKDSMIESIEKYSDTATSTNKYDELSRINKYKITRINKTTAIVDIQDQNLKFKLNKTPERYWRVVAIEGFMDDKATTTEELK